MPALERGIISNPEGKGIRRWEECVLKRLNPWIQPWLTHGLGKKKKNPTAEARDCQKGGRVVVRVSLSDKVTFDVFLILSSCKLST